MVEDRLEDHVPPQVPKPLSEGGRIIDQEGQNLVRYKFWFEGEDIEELYRIAPLILRKRKIHCRKDRQAAFVLRMILKEGLEKLRLEVGERED